jgi:predicted small integral membrane protein
MSRTKRRLAIGLLFAALCVLALIGLVGQALWRGRT